VGQQKCEMGITGAPPCQNQNASPNWEGLQGEKKVGSASVTMQSDTPSLTPQPTSSRPQATKWLDPPLP
jgi:hypothetical protein